MRIPMNRIATWSRALLVSLFVMSCNSGGGDPTPPTASELVNQGWQAYSAKNYQSASDKFNQALGMDGNFVDAYNGAGWASAKLNQLATAVSKFTVGLGKDTANLEIKAGLSIVLHAQHNYAQSILYASQVLASRPGWSFTRDATLGASDLHLLLAECYFGMADYASSLAETKVLNPSFNTDISTVAGQTALAEEIERLRSIV
jgi:tetratricopeptide (TPR) repeat protein